MQLKDAALFKDKRSICLSKLQDPDGMLRAFGQYYGRHKAMEEYREQSRQAA